MLLSPYFLPAWFAVFFTLRVLVLLIPVEPKSDAAWYFSRALGIVEHGSYSEGGIPTAYWPIGYPGFLGLVFNVLGPSLLVGQFVNLLFAAATFWLVYQFAKSAFLDEQSARASVALLTVYPNSIGYVPLVLTETFYTFLLLGAGYIYLFRHSWARLLGAGLLFGAATLVKSQTILLTLLLIPFALLFSEGRKRWRMTILEGAAILLIACAVVAPWTARNYATFGVPIFVSTNAGMTLLGGNNPGVVGDYRHDYSITDPRFAIANFSVADQVNADRRARRLAFEWIRENPLAFLSLMPKKFWRLWAPDGEAEWAFQAGTPGYDRHYIAFRVGRVANQAFYVLIMVLSATALVALRRLEPRSSIYFGYLVAGFVTLVSLVFSGQSRYHFPVMPFLLMYSGWVLVGPLGIVRQRIGVRRA